MPSPSAIVCCIIVLILLGGIPLLVAAEPLPYTGVNLAGAEFGEHSLPGTYGVDYIYPDAEDIGYFAGQGMNLIRLPFRWERLQRSLSGAFDATEWLRLQETVAAARAQGMVVILDPHNYARWHGDLIGSAAVPQAAFDDFWSRLASAYAEDEEVWFGLMNEPHGIDASDWVVIANQTIAAIRAAGADNPILVPGTAWTGAHSWSQDWYGTPNATALLTIDDPADNLVIEVHQYLDGDSSGTSDGVVSASIGSERIAGFTAWCREHGYRAFLGEFAAPRSDLADLAIDDLLASLAAADDVWLGWSWWAAGPWWGDYLFTLQPDGEADRPQMVNLRPALAPERHISIQVQGVGAPVRVGLDRDLSILRDGTRRGHFAGRAPQEAQLLVFSGGLGGDG